MRARQPQRQMVPLEPFARWLERRYAELGTLAKVGEALGCSSTRVCDLLNRRAARNGGPRGPVADIDRAAVERYLERDGTTTFAALYAAGPAEASAA